MALRNLRQRQIYWLDDCEPLDGDADKDRPVIVLSTPEMLRKAAEPVLIVACTTHPRRKDVPRFEIPMTSETGLRKKCWALPKWFLTINGYRLQQFKGNCPEPLFGDIFEAVMAAMDSGL